METLIGTIIGALIVGIFAYFQTKQSIDSKKLENKKELLLVRYECMYKELFNYHQYLTEISLLTINSINANLDIKKLKTNLKDNDFDMYSKFYTPELSPQMTDLTNKLGNVIEALSDLIIKSDSDREEKEKLIGTILTSSLELQDTVKNIQKELSKIANKLIKT